MELEYSITESIHRNPQGHIVQIGYRFEELVVIETAPSSSSTITKQNRERRYRTYDATVTREQYRKLAFDSANPLPFDAFVSVLRPFIMGYYDGDELEHAFQILDRNQSGSIHVNELSSFLTILNETVTSETLKDYVQKVDANFDGTMNYDEFRALVLRGISRDIICNQV